MDAGLKQEILDMMTFVVEGRRKSVERGAAAIVADLTEYKGRPDHNLAREAADLYGESRFADGYQEAIRDVIRLIEAEERGEEGRR